MRWKEGRKGKVRKTLVLAQVYCFSSCKFFEGTMMKPLKTSDRGISNIIKINKCCLENSNGCCQLLDRPQAGPAKRGMQSDSTTSLPDGHTGAVCEFMSTQECTWKEVWPLNSMPVYLKGHSVAWFFLPSLFVMFSFHV